MPLWLKYKLGFSKDDEACEQERKNILHDDVILRLESLRVLLSYKLQIRAFDLPQIYIYIYIYI